MHTVEERKFLYTLCSNALGMDESIVFTGVVNDCGKLIVGVPRLFVDQKNGPEGDSLFKSPPDSSCIFFSQDDGLYSIKIMKNIFINFNVENKSDFQIINVQKDKYVAIFSLTETHDKYLCIYFETKKPVNTILKLNTIFE
jgi:hypothetical protein